MANFINFSVLGLYAGTVHTSSGIFAGENLQYGWRSTSKTNCATEKICGDSNIIAGGRQEVIDPDWLDTFIQKAHPYTELKPPSPVLMALQAKQKKRYRRRDVEDWDW